MPDWLTHVLIGWFLCDLLSVRYRGLERYRTAFLVGSILPDARYAELFLRGHIDLLWFSWPIHTPIGVLLIAGIAALVLDSAPYFYILSLTGIAHILADLLVVTGFGGRETLLFPFSFQMYSLGLFWQESLYPTYIALALVLASTLLRRSKLP